MAERTLNRPCGGRYGSVVDAVGNTPLVELPSLSPKPGCVRIYAKLEGRNPTGSVKDRVAKSMIETAEAEGAISPGQTILEPTSGNTGIALAMIGRMKGYPVKVVMPDNVTEERTQLLRMFGAEIIYSEGAKGSNGAVEMALDLAEKNPDYYMPYQYGNPANPLAHYNGTAVEILEELDEVHAFVAGLGTGGTLMGVGRRLKEHDPNTKIVAAEPMQGELVQGLRSLDDGFIPPIIDLSLLDRKIMVSNRDAIELARLVHRYASPDVTEAEIDWLLRNTRHTRTIWLKRRVPLEVIYDVVEVRDGVLHIHPDVYRTSGKTVRERAIQALMREGYDVSLLDMDRLRKVVQRGQQRGAAVPIEMLFPTAAGADPGQ